MTGVYIDEIVLEVVDWFGAKKFWPRRLKFKQQLRAKIVKLTDESTEKIRNIVPEKLVLSSPNHLLVFTNENILPLGLAYFQIFKDGKHTNIHYFPLEIKVSVHTFISRSPGIKWAKIHPIKKIQKVSPDSVITSGEYKDYVQIETRDELPLEEDVLLTVPKNGYQARIIYESPIVTLTVIKWYEPSDPVLGGLVLTESRVMQISDKSSKIANKRFPNLITHRFRNNQNIYVLTSDLDLPIGQVDFSLSKINYKARLYYPDNYTNKYRYEIISLAEPTFATVGEYMRNDNTIRSGIIPYFLDKGVEYWIMSRSIWTNKLGDFGGGCKDEDNFDPLICMKREFSEESSKYIYDITVSSIDKLNEENHESLDYSYENNGLIYKDSLTIKYLNETIFRGRKEGISWLVLVPINITIVDFLKKQGEFVREEYNPLLGRGEIRNIELIPIVYIMEATDDDLEEIFDPTIIRFVKNLLT